MNRGLALFILAVAVGGCAARLPSPSVPSEAVAAETLTVAPSPTPTLLPTPTPTAALSLPALLSVNARGSEKSSPFAASGASVDLAYVLDCSNIGRQGNLVVDLIDANGALVDEVGNLGLANVGADAVAVDLANTVSPYRVDVASECLWAVVVRTP
ncbi:MAG: hypothetical protein ACHQ01_04435 [Candidatus Limnocylindrales bacterium]